MKKQLRKYLSVERRDLRDSPEIYQFWSLSVDRLKHKLKHVNKRDRIIKGRLEDMINWKCKNWEMLK